MKWIVSVGWSIYPIGYFLGYLGGGTDVATVNAVYNLADFINKIAFGLVILGYACLTQKKRSFTNLKLRGIFNSPFFMKNALQNISKENIQTLLESNSWNNLVIFNKTDLFFKSNVLNIAKKLDVTENQYTNILATTLGWVNVQNIICRQAGDALELH